MFALYRTIDGHTKAQMISSERPKKIAQVILAQVKLLPYRISVLIEKARILAIKWVNASINFVVCYSGILLGFIIAVFLYVLKVG